MAGLKEGKSKPLLSKIALTAICQLIRGASNISPNTLER